MGSMASTCCIQRDGFKNEQSDPVADNGPTRERKSRAVAAPKAASSEVSSEHGDAAKVSDREQDGFERQDTFETGEGLQFEDEVNLHPNMTVVFQTGCGSTQLVTFTERPVGMGFGPVAHWGREVKKVVPGSHAEEEGVKPGWSILSINGESLIDADGESIHKKFSDAVSVLDFSKAMISRRASWEECSSPANSSRSTAASVTASPLK